jgi:hypothetical protein
MGDVVSSAPPEAWFVLVGTMMGALITLFGVWLTNRSSIRVLSMQLQHDRDEKQRDKTRERHEQLYIECRRYFGDIVSYFLPYRSVMRGDMTYNLALDMTIADGKSSSDANRVFMLVDFYFPEFKDDLLEVVRVRDQLNKIMSGFSEQYRTGDTDGARWLELFQPAFEELAEKMEAFEERVAQQRPSA